MHCLHFVLEKVLLRLVRPRNVPWRRGVQHVLHMPGYDPGSPPTVGLDPPRWDVPCAVGLDGHGNASRADFGSAKTLVRQSDLPCANYSGCAQTPALRPLSPLGRRPYNRAGHRPESRLAPLTPPTTPQLHQYVTDQFYCLQRKMCYAQS